MDRALLFCRRAPGITFGAGDFASIAYDKFMGGHFFERVAGLLSERFPDVSVEDFAGPCRAAFAGAFPDADRYMPDTVHYFSETRDRFDKPAYRDTGQRPRWRP